MSWQCSHCNRSFSRPNALMQHIFQKHPFLSNHSNTEISNLSQQVSHSDEEIWDLPVYLLHNIQSTSTQPISIIMEEQEEQDIQSTSDTSEEQDIQLTLDTSDLLLMEIETQESDNLAQLTLIDEDDYKEVSLDDTYEDL